MKPNGQEFGWKRKSKKRKTKKDDERIWESEHLEIHLGSVLPFFEREYYLFVSNWCWRRRSATCNIHLCIIGVWVLIMLRITLQCHHQTGPRLRPELVAVTGHRGQHAWVDRLRCLRG